MGDSGGGRIEGFCIVNEVNCRYPIDVAHLARVLLHRLFFTVFDFPFDLQVASCSPVVGFKFSKVTPGANASRDASFVPIKKALMSDLGDTKADARQVSVG